MSVRRQIWIVVALIAALVWTVWNHGGSEERAVSQNVECQGVAKPEIGFCAPNFTLKQMDGQAVELYRNGGKPTVINFWATWCPPCKKEMPMLQTAYERYKNQIRFLMVNETAQEPDPSQVKKYLDHNRYTFPVLLDPATDQGTVGMDRYRLIGIPVTFIVDPNGKITHKFVGGLKEDAFFRVLEELAASSPPAGSKS